MQAATNSMQNGACSSDMPLITQLRHNVVGFSPVVLLVPVSDPELLELLELEVLVDSSGKRTSHEPRSMQ
jgi:hypothetical protein